VPAPVWDAIRAAATVSSPPTVLLATWDPYVPWELAVVPEPWDPDGPPFLGAQAVIGRWPYSEQVRAPVPALRIEAQSMATVKGEYGGSKRLEEAEKEADHLKDSYKAAQVPARIRPILDCLGKATPPAHILHMAVHGRFDHTGTQDGILMEDGKYLRPRSIPASRRPPTSTSSTWAWSSSTPVSSGRRRRCWESTRAWPPPSRAWASTR